MILTYYQGRFLCNNYDQALSLIDQLEDELEHQKDALRIESDGVFLEWLKEEAAFLSIKPDAFSEREQSEMDYVKILQDLAVAE